MSSNYLTRCCVFSGIQKIMIVRHKVLEKFAGVKPLPLIGLGISDILFQRDLVRAFPPLKHRNTEDQFVGLADTAEIKLVLKRPT